MTTSDTLFTITLWTGSLPDLSMSLLDGLEDEVESVLFVAREISCGL